jgi:O-antigen/teichoic acid export membrane protein
MRSLRDVWYAPLLAGAMALMMARLLLFARLLTIDEFAAVSGGLLVSSTFCMLGCVGLQSMLQREWPVDIVRGRERRALVLAAQCNLTAFGCALAALLLSGFAPTLSGMSGGVVASGILHGFSQQLFLIATVESRSRGASIRYSWENVARAAAVLLLAGAAAASTGSAWCILAAETAVALTLSLFLFRSSAARVSESLGRIYTLALRGLPRIKWWTALTLMVIASLGFLIANTDRWAAAKLLDGTLFGVYSFAWIILMVAQAVQAVVNASLYPLLARTFASQGRRGAFRICLLSSAGFLAAGIVLALPAWLLFDWAISHWYQKFSAALAIVPMFLAVAILRVSDFWSSYLLIVGEEARLLAVNGAAALIGAAVWIAWSRPWSVQVDLVDVSWLAVFLVAIAWLAVAATAMKARNAHDHR